MFKRVLDSNFEEGLQIWNYIKTKIPIEKSSLNTNLKDYILKLVVVRSFCFGLILSPPLAWIAKNGYLWVKYKPFSNFLPLWQIIIRVKIIPNWRAMQSDGEGWTIWWSGVEALSSPKNSISLSIYDLAWNTLENHISHSTWKRYDQRYISKWCVQNINQNS